ncbi:DegV family protein [Romboutsia sp.]|uniref:DegV family protein n=1 Tax=Romboutsia sp. TaxID=1965302 RepID=UPI003F312784
MSKIKLITDGSCDLSKDIIEKYNIEVIGLNVLFGDESFIGGEEIDNQTFYKRMSESQQLPKTSCPSPEKFIESYNCEVDNILVLTISSKLSGTYSSAILAKKMFTNENYNKNIEIIDTLNGCAGQGALVVKAAQMIEEGKSFEEIIETIEKIKYKIVHFGTLETLENAIKGGRISALKASIVNAFNFKVIVQITDGLVKPVDKARGEVNSLKKVVESVLQLSGDTSEKILSIAHANCPHKADKVRELLEKEHQFKKIIISEVGPVMGTYTSKGAILVSAL